MIPYVEVIGKYSLLPTSVIEPSECWFELAYYDLGEFEVYAPATSNNLSALKLGNYIKLPNKPYLWVIKSVQYTFNAEGARMIDVKGYEAKWILNQRIILSPVQIPINLANAIYRLVYNNLGAGASAPRKIEGFNVIQPTFNITIEQTQATRGNLYDFIHELLKSNSCGSYTTYENGQITYRAIQGVDRSSYMIFSQSIDNLISSDYYENSEDYKTFCWVVSKFSEENALGENVDVYYTQLYNLPSQPRNIDRHEILLESNLSTKFTDASGNEQEVSPSSALYQSWQQQEGKNKLGECIIKREFNGEIDLHTCQYEFGTDFFIGDLIKVRDEYFGYEQSTRVLKYRFKQDSSGYGEEVEYGNE